MMKDEVAGVKAMIKNLKDQIRQAQANGNDILLADLKSVYQNLLVEKDRLK